MFHEITVIDHIVAISNYDQHLQGNNYFVSLTINRIKGD